MRALGGQLQLFSIPAAVLLVGLTIYNYRRTRQRRWLAPAVLVLLYVFSYSVLRISHVFVHGEAMDGRYYNWHDIRFGRPPYPAELKAVTIRRYLYCLFGPIRAGELRYWHAKRPLGSVVSADSHWLHRHEEGFVMGLGIITELRGGVFPEYFGSIETSFAERLAELGLTDEFEKKLDSLNLSEDARRELLWQLDECPEFLGRFEHRGQWHYAGAGVILGDNTEPVLWYRTCPEHPYRVVYGDLSVRNVDPGKLSDPPDHADPKGPDPVDSARGSGSAKLTQARRRPL